MCKGRFDEKAGCTKKLPLLHWKEKTSVLKITKIFYACVFCYLRTIFCDFYLKNKSLK